MYPFDPVLPTPCHYRRRLCVILAGALCLASILRPAPAQALGPIEDEQNLSRTRDHSESPQIASGGGRLVVVWGERSHRQIGYIFGAPGAGWSDAATIDTGTNTAVQWPGVAVDSGGAAHLVYASGGTIFYRAQAGGGWAAPVVVWTGAFPNITRIAVAPDGTLWIVWREGEGSSILYRYSNDAGQSWRAGDDGGVIAAGGGNLDRPSLAVDHANGAHVVWYNRNQGDLRSADWNGSRFVTASVTADGAARYDVDPFLTVDRQNVEHLVWRTKHADAERWDVSYARRPPGGGWQDWTVVATTNGNAGYGPAIGTDEIGDVYVTYSNPLPGGPHNVNLYVKTVDGRWEGLSLSRGRFDTRSSVLGAVVGGNIVAYAVYQHEQGNDDGEIIYKRVLVGSAPPPPAQPAPPPPAQPAPPPQGNPAMQPAQPRADCTYAAATQHNLCAGFRSYWQRFGGRAIFGDPISEEFVENGVTVQYFERARFEWHPGAAPQRNDVLLGWLGSELTAGRRDAGEAPFQGAPARSGANCTYVAATQHNLCAGFRSYWQRFGGRAIFGDPISEEFVENGVTVQYFQQARFEWHPGLAPQRDDVLLGRVGAEVLAGRGP